MGEILVCSLPSHLCNSAGGVSPSNVPVISACISSYAGSIIGVGVPVAVLSALSTCGSAAASPPPASASSSPARPSPPPPPPALIRCPVPASMALDFTPAAVLCGSAAAACTDACGGALSFPFVGSGGACVGPCACADLTHTYTATLGPESYLSPAQIFRRSLQQPLSPFHSSAFPPTKPSSVSATDNATLGACVTARYMDIVGAGVGAPVLLARAACLGASFPFPPPVAPPPPPPSQARSTPPTLRWNCTFVPALRRIEEGKEAAGTITLIERRPLVAQSLAAAASA